MGCNSNERVDPQIIFKLMFLLFCENLPGERMRRRMAAEGLDYLWVLDRIGMMSAPPQATLQGAQAVGSRGL